MSKRDEACSTCEQCRDRLLAGVSETNGGRGVSPQIQGTAESFQRIGPDCIPSLMQLLENQDPAVQYFTGYVVRDMPGLSERELPKLIQLVRSSKRGTWVEAAIAQIDTPQAVSFLIEELIRQKETENQLGYAIKLCGPKCVLPLVELVASGAAQDPRAIRAVTNSFGEIRTHAEPAISPLLALASDRSKSLEIRKTAILALGGIGWRARSADIALSDIGKQSQELLGAVYTAQEKMASPEVARVLARLLSSEKKTRNRTLALRDIAAIGKAGYAAGPDVARLLTSSEWELRHLAARTLGYTGYRPAAPALRQALRNKTDWRLNLAAAEALGTLDPVGSAKELREFERSHWHPSVRKAAADALAGAALTVESEETQSTFPSVYFGFSPPHAGRVSCDLPAGHILGLNLEHKGLTLHGEDRGEWGGSLVVTDSNSGRAQRVFALNVRFVARRDDEFLAVAGDGMELTADTLYRLARKEGRWAASPVLVLPGNTRGAVQLDTGEIRVCTSEGLVRIAKDNSIRFAE